MLRSEYRIIALVILAFLLYALPYSQTKMESKAFTPPTISLSMSDEQYQAFSDCRLGLQSSLQLQGVWVTGSEVSDFRDTQFLTTDQIGLHYFDITCIDSLHGIRWQIDFPRLGIEVRFVSPSNGGGDAAALEPVETYGSPLVATPTPHPSDVARPTPVSFATEPTSTMACCDSPRRSDEQVDTPTIDQH